MSSFLCKNIIVPTVSCNVVVLRSKEVDFVYIYNKKFFFIGKFLSACWGVSLDARTLALSLAAVKNSKISYLKIAYLAAALCLNRISARLTN